MLMLRSSHSTLRLVFACLGITLGGLHIASAQGDFPVGADNFADAQDISIRRGNTLTNLFIKSSEPGEPGHRANGDKAARKSAWWKWTAPETGFCTVDSRRTEGVSNGVFSTSLAVYRGDSLASLIRVAGNDTHSFEEFHVDAAYSSVTFRAEAGVTYCIALDGFRNAAVTTDFPLAALQLRHIPLRKMVRRGVFQLIRNRDLIDLGSIAVTTTATGRLTGKLITTKKTYSFTGSIGNDGFFTTSFEPPIAKPGIEQEPPITLALDMAGDGSFALYHNNISTHGEFPEPTITSPNATTPLASYNTAYIGADDASLGHLAFTIKENGSIRGTGVAPDGSSFSFATSLFTQATDPHIPIHVPLHGKKGGLILNLICFGTGRFGPDGQRRFSMREFLGAFIRPPSSKAFYTQGIAGNISAAGGTYFPPSAELLRPFDFLNPNGEGEFILFSAEGELENNIQEDVILEPSGKVAFEGATLKPVIKLNPKTGLITGSITEPGKKKRTLRGVISQDNELIQFGGLTTGTTRNLDFFIFPRFP